MRRVAFRTAVARFVHSVLRRRRLLVPAGKIVFAEGAAKLPEHFGRLALGVQGLARLAAEGLPSEHGLDSVPFVLLGDRRQAHNLPILLCQHMAREVVPRVKPEGRLSCSLCMISTIVPESLSLSLL
jgi:hypothetical protein